MPQKRLSELDGEICSISGRPETDDCLMFICPVCNNGHGIIVSFRPPSLFPSGAVWIKTGESIEEISIHPSINCDVSPEGESPCKFHGWVKNGNVTW